MREMSLENSVLEGCAANGREYVFEKGGGTALFPVKNAPKGYSYFSFELENREDFAVRLEIKFCGKNDPREPLFSITVGVLPGIATPVNIPLAYLGGQILFGRRQKGMLKTVISGTRLALTDIGAVGIHRPAGHKESRLCIKNVCFTNKIKEPDICFDDLIDEFYQNRGKDWPGKTKSAEELRQYLDGELDKAEKYLNDQKDFTYGFGGAKLKATGFFRTEKLENGRFTLVTPEGRAFFSSGLDCVRPSIDGPMEDGVNHNFLEENLRKIYGDEWREKWRILTEYRLRKWGINTVAAWSEIDFAKTSGVPYVLVFNDYPRTAKTIFRDFPDVFSPEYRERAKEYAKQLAPYKGAKNLIGYFLSNEPNWAFVGDLNLGYELFISDESLVSKKYLIEYLKNLYGGDIKKLNEAFGTRFEAFDGIYKADITFKISDGGMKILDLYTKELVREYVKAPSLALREVDPDHLNLGIRYAFISSDALYSGCEYFDVFSINCYDDTCEKDVKRVFEKVNMPVVVGEYHFGALDAGLPATGIRGVMTQRDRGEAISRYIANAASLGCCVGVHYFQLSDQPYTGRFDGENYNIGLVDICCREYAEVAEKLASVNSELEGIIKGAVKTGGEEGIHRIPPIFF